jgi:hypothetical protein
MIAANTIAAIIHAEAFTDDKRKLLVYGNSETIETLKREDAKRWRDVPECFRPASTATPKIVGAFYGVPVAADENIGPGKVFIMLGDLQLASTSNEGLTVETIEKENP